jgi:8-oxo-dGTP diphosphatase
MRHGNAKRSHTFEIPLPAEQSLIQVTAARSCRRNPSRVAQRPPEKQSGLLWEFPGGKVEAGESLEESLQREIREELCLGVEVKGLFQCVKHRQASLHLDLFAYWCAIIDGKVCLKEHLDSCWALICELERFIFTGPDELVVSSLQKLHALPDFSQPARNPREFRKCCHPGTPEVK